ncbi:MAG: AAA-like domain-containing protein [Cyanobacteria bacterium P01_A01_bin.84]
MNLDFILETVEHKLIDRQIHPLNSTEVLILHGVWEYKTYNQIAIKAGYSPGYFTNVVAPELYQRLSKLLGQRVTKKNCRMLLESYATTQVNPQTKRDKQFSMEFTPKTNQNTPLSYPSGSVPLNSPFYLKRNSIEEQVYQEISKPGALIRIKAPREMGKTSLLNRIVDHAKSLGYQTVSLNLEQVERETLSDLNQFLRWLCANIAHQLQFKPMLDEYWDEDLGSKISSTIYFQDYLLELIESPLVLALDEMNHIFEHPKVAKDFLPLLRSWYEEAKRLPIWQKLRLLVVHSTEIYVPLDIDQSPFNIGLPIQLDTFSAAQVQLLAQHYGLHWVLEKEVRQLMVMVGGHPALVNLALYHLSQKGINLCQFLETATSATGIYSYHLQRHWATLKTQPELALAFNTVLNATEPIRLDPIVVHKLISMGLIKLLDNQAIVSCELYRQFFTKKELQDLIDTSSPT